jgi:hypothetical protein
MKAQFRRRAGVDQVTLQRRALREADFDPIPVHGKAPVIETWPKKLNVPTKEIDSWQHLGGKNTGLLTARMPTFDVDILNPQGAGAVEKLIRQHLNGGLMLKRVGKAPKFCVPFKTAKPFAKILCRLLPKGAADDAEPEKLEFLGDGQQVVAFGTHPDTKQPYRWNGTAPGEVRREQLPEIEPAAAADLVKQAAELLIAKHGYRLAPDERKKNAEDPWAQFIRVDWSEMIGNIIAGDKLHESIRDLSASMIGAGVSANATREVLTGVMNHSAARRDNKRRWKQRFDAIDRTIAGAERQFGTVSAPPADWQESELFDPWAPTAVPGFPLAVLPPLVQDFVAGQVEVLGCDAASTAMTILTAFSGAIHHASTLKMMRNGNWYASPRLWVLLCGDPSRRKTPLINAATAPLEDYQAEEQAVYRRELAAADKDERDAVIPPDRLVLWDTTIEKLGELLAHSDRGVLVKRDEFAGWIGSMEKYSGRGGAASSNRAFWLKSFDGGPYVVDRISRGSVFISNLSVSLIGGIQPEKLAELHGLTSDGLLQRFLAVMMGPTKAPIDRTINTNAYDLLVRDLIEGPPLQLTLADDALEVMTAMRNELFELEQAVGGLATGFQAFVGKLAGMAGTLALILHRISDSKKTVVLRATAENVHHLVFKFLLRHALAFYRMSEGAGGGDRLRKLASWLLTNGCERVVASDFTSNIYDCRGLTLPQLQERLSPLVAAGWLHPLERTPACRSWSVNPKVFAMFAERRQREDVRKEQVRECLFTPAEEDSQV